MTLVLDATLGGVNSNAYLTVQSAQRLIDAIPNATAWGDDDEAQALALVRATTLLEVLAYQGTKVSRSQALAWPRFGVPDPDYGDVSGSDLSGECAVDLLDTDAIPRRMLRACVALALEILKAGTADLWGADQTSNMESLAVGPITIAFTDTETRRRGLRAFPQVWREVFPLTTAAEPARVVRG